MLRVGLVAEGASDWLVLKAIILRVRPDSKFEEVQPDRTLTSRRSFGWIGVKSWCQEFGHQLENFMAQFGVKPLDLMVIHVDCSMAKEAGAERPCPPSADTAAALALVVDETWLGRSPRPSFVLLALPSMTTDTWVVATLDPPYANLADIECDRAAENQLIRSVWGGVKRLRLKDGQVKKSSTKYAPFADLVGANLPLVLERCPQARAFHDDFLRAAAIVSPRPGL